MHYTRNLFLRIVFGINVWQSTDNSLLDVAERKDVLNRFDGVDMCDHVYID